MAKESNLPKPWSEDWVFQETYFCNVRREDDRVTRWIRQNWSPDYLGWGDYEYAMVVARFLNWPVTLERISALKEMHQEFPKPAAIELMMQATAAMGEKVWGNAYVVTTHGIPMGKAAYLCERVLPAAYDLLGAGRWRGAYAGSPPTLARRHEELMSLEGLGSFMAAQVIADLKNTTGHPLDGATDWLTWSAPGPGSLRGLAWYFEAKVTALGYQSAMEIVARELPTKARDLLSDNVMGGVNMQDLQNCLCEYDKYMRVLSGTGRSKRSYDGR